jgi:signal transduction histidine kinase
MLRPLLTAESVSLVFDPPPVDNTFRSDEGRVSQILRNLVSNAVKFTEHGEIRVSARMDEETDGIEFIVSDTGIGIPERDLERIFEDYSQLESALQKRSVGTGLGLPLSRRLTTLLGGTLTVTSTVGKGSIFTLRLPRVCPEVGTPDSGSAADAAAATSPRSVQHA